MLFILKIQEFLQLRYEIENLNTLRKLSKFFFAISILLKKPNRSKNRKSITDFHKNVEKKVKRSTNNKILKFHIFYRSCVPKLEICKEIETKLYFIKQANINVMQCISNRLQSILHIFD